MWRPIIGMYVVSETYLETTHNRKWLRAWSMQDQTVAYLNASCNATCNLRSSFDRRGRDCVCASRPLHARAAARPPARARARAVASYRPDAQRRGR